MPTDSDKRQHIKDLITRRSSAKGQITKFRNYLASISSLEELSNIQLTELNLKLAKFEALSVRVDDLQSEIEVLCPDNIDNEIDERDDIEREIIVNMATAKTLLEKFNKKTECEIRHTSIDSSDIQETSIRLPQIQIARFDGAYFRWLEFRDTFENLIHNNPRILPIHKFHYLISYLEGDASRVISNLEVSSANYTEAWELLCNRYNNKRILINHHLNALFNIKPLVRESERSLRFLIDHVTKNLRALHSLGQPTDKWDVLVIFMLSSKLDSVTLAKWEEYKSTLDSDTASLEQFNKFMIDRADVLESLNRNKPYENIGNNSRGFQSNMSRGPQANQNKQGQNNYTKSFAAMGSSKQPKSNNTSFLCLICNNNHKIYDCPTFKAMSVDERFKNVTKYKLCVNCLRQGHPVGLCRMGPCRDCNKRHNSLLHNPDADHIQHDSSPVETIDQKQNEAYVYFSKQYSNQILLSTALVLAVNPLTQQKVKVRALLDCGSQSSFISKSLKEQLVLKSIPIDCLKVIGIGNKDSIDVVESCNVKIQSLNNKFNIISSCLVLNELTGSIPKQYIDVKAIKLPNGISLADPNFYKPAPIDLLIGADLFWDILGNEQQSLGPLNPRLRSSQLGWIISGPTYTNSIKGVTNCNHASISELNNVDKLLPKFWAIEEVPSKCLLSNKDKECERLFVTHTLRDANGRFCVKLPLLDSPDCLGDSYKLAKKRLLSLEKRFRRNPLLKQDYSNFIMEYKSLGHLSPVTDPSNNNYYLCHHAVLKQESESTKLRVVFDGSAPSTSGYALNDILMVGPNVQESLFSILIRARQYRFLLTGDIEKMYRQILVDERDRDLQRILWREDDSRPIQMYKLNTVTYGTASASYLSTRCLWQLGEEQDDELIKTIIQKDFYVDDLITGADSEEELCYIQTSVVKALQAGCFHLRKFKSNVPSIFKNIDIKADSNLTISESSSTLGLGWSPSNDKLFFPIKNFITASNTIITKRLILSNSFRIFDPLGILSPVVIKPKILLQKLWLHKLGWDQPVPDDIKSSWLKLVDSLCHIKNLEVPRLTLCNFPVSVELHSFSDASQNAYGACIYLKSTSVDGKSTVKLLCAKSKVAPLKPTTIPRLELCAALLSVKLSTSVLNALRYKPNKVVHWCDSSVVLSWLNNDLTKLKLFVANRVAEILECSHPSWWRYVPTHENPADLISRGIDANVLDGLSLWWSGPKYLSKVESEWPTLKAEPLSSIPEIKVHVSVTNSTIIDIDRFSSLNRLQRSYAYVLRFIFNTKNSKTKRLGILSIDELHESLNSLYAMAQRESFATEYNLLAASKPLNNKSKISSLSPFLDNHNLIRVGGRLNASLVPYEKKHPILLHGNHKITKLLFQREHVNNMHAGPQLLLATVKESVWPVNGRHLARRTYQNCVTCRRLRAKTIVPKMGDLPAQRVNPDFPFVSVGIDFAGPFFILNRKGRGSRLIKCYLCVFVCLRYKCIHLEAVSDMSKDAFIMTLRRFIARRGKPIEIFCDNGRNFVAAAKEIGHFLQQNEETLSQFASQQGISFKFIPTYAPHFGGIWEAGVKSAKFHIRRVMANSKLTFEEISTLFAQVEAILNSRPLCPLSSSPNDLLPLSPGHFLIGRPLTALPPPLEDKEVKDPQQKRYKLLETIRLHFWQRWQREYLCELQQRTKWKQNTSRLSIGDMVLLAEDNLPPLSWRLGRVVELHPGPDSVSRVADVKTVRGVVRRALTRLCPLPRAEEL